MLHSLTHSQSKCALSLGTQMRTQHAYKVELIDWKWIRIFELKFNYTSNTWIHFPFSKIRVLQIKKSLLNTTPPSLYQDPFPPAEVTALGFLLLIQNVLQSPLKHVFCSLVVCLFTQTWCVQAGGVPQLSTPCEAPGTADMCHSVPLPLATGGPSQLHCVWFPISCWLTIKAFPVSFH